MSPAPTIPGISRRGVLAGAAVGAAAGLGATAPVNAYERPFAASGSGRPGRRPNILVIMVDDLGWADLSSYGSPHIATPNIDRLAASGVRFTDGYSASAVCSPTRFALYTGRYAQRLPGGLQEPISTPSERDGIPAEHPTLASLLKGGGYRTALFGKWHGGFLPWFSPLRSGWDEFVGNYSGGVDYFSKYAHNGLYDLYDGEEQIEDPRYYTDIIAQQASRFVSRDHDRPWLLNLNFTSPHWPWEGRGDLEVSRELTERLLAGDSRSLFHDDGGSVEKYTEMVEDVDRAIGRVLGALRRSGAREDTLVLFASDNGGERFSYNWPLSGEKVSLHEGGIRVPTILSWPAALRRRQVDSTPVHTVDWTATLLDAAGVQPDPDHPLDGTSLLGHLLDGEALPERDLFWRMRGQRALRRGDLKYVQDTAGTDHLYDLAADVREQADLARRRPDDLAALRRAWEGIDATLLPYAA